MLTKSDRVTVNLYPGDRQLIELAAAQYGVSLSEFCRVIASCAAQKVAEDLRNENRIQEAEWEEVDKTPQLPNLPHRSDLEKAVNAFQTTIRRRYRY